MIYAISGMCGAGKTHRRTTDPKLKNLTFIDIADAYAEFPSGVRKVIVDSIDMTMNISENAATFDMNVNRRVPRSEL